MKDHGDTALHTAVRKHDVDMAKLLAEKSANINITNVSKLRQMQLL